MRDYNYPELYRKARLSNKPLHEYTTSELVGYYATKMGNWKSCLLRDIEEFNISSRRGYAAERVLRMIMEEK